MKQLLFAIILASSITTVAEPKQYSYMDVKIGVTCQENDCTESYRELPAYFAWGYHWTVLEDIDIEAEIQRRSVKGDRGTEKYDRNGFFIKGRYKFSYVW